MRSGSNASGPVGALRTGAVRPRSSVGLELSLDAREALRAGEPLVILDGCGAASKLVAISIEEIAAEAIEVIPQRGERLPDVAREGREPVLVPGPSNSRMHCAWSRS